MSQASNLSGGCCDWLRCGPFGRRNDRIFEAKETNLDKMASMIRMWVCKWVLIKEEFQDLQLIVLFAVGFLSWKVRKWSSPIGGFKLIVEELVRGKPELVGIVVCFGTTKEFC